METHPATVAVADDKAVLVVPLLSWFHSAFDAEPELDGWEYQVPVTAASDFQKVSWPFPLSLHDDSVAELLDERNDAHYPIDLGPSIGKVSSFVELCGKCKEGAFSAVLSLSHFLPRIELLPERRYMAFPHLMKIVGSKFLGRRVDRLRPTCHVFGHTHYGWDSEIDGVRYMQGALGSAMERKRDPMRFALDGFLDVDDAESRPLLVLDSSCSLPPLRRGAFSRRHLRSAWLETQ